jgi:hypothetical protein
MAKYNDETTNRLSLMNVMANLRSRGWNFLNYNSPGLFYINGTIVVKICNGYASFYYVKKQDPSYSYLYAPELEMFSEKFKTPADLTDLMTSITEDLKKLQDFEVGVISCANFQHKHIKPPTDHGKVVLNRPEKPVCHS